jgi:hypothetical protein
MLENRSGVVVVAAHHHPQRLRVSAMAERGGTGQVTEKHTDELADLPRLRGPQRGAAERTEPEIIRALTSAFSADHHGRSLVF